MSRPDDRDRQPPKSRPFGVPTLVVDEGTGVHEGEELARIRARRPTAERLARLEKKHDGLDKTVTETRVLVGRMDEKLDALITERRESRQFWRKIAAGIILAIVGAYIKTRIG